MDAASFGSFFMEDENEDDEILNRSTISIDDVPDVKKSFLSFYFSGKPVRDIPTRKELYVSQLMTLDDETRSKLLNDAIKEEQDLYEYKSKLELTCKQVTSLREEEKSIASVLQQKKNILDHWKENHHTLTTQTMLQLSTVNDRIKLENGCLDAEIYVLSNRARAASAEQKKILDRINAKIKEKERMRNQLNTSTQ